MLPNVFSRRFAAPGNARTSEELCGQKIIPWQLLVDVWLNLHANGTTVQRKNLSVIETMPYLLNLFAIGRPVEKFAPDPIALR